MRQPNPDMQRWCEEKFAEMDVISANLNAIFDRRSKKSVGKSDIAQATSTQFSTHNSVNTLTTVPVDTKDAKKKIKSKSAEPVKKPKEVFKVKTPISAHHLPNINEHKKNRAQFWQVRNEKAVQEYRSLSDAEKLERAARLKTAYEEELCKFI